MKEIKLSSGESTLVDDEDYEALNFYSWYKHVTAYKVYARTKTTKLCSYMHRLLIPSAYFIDHKDGNGLNNQRYNLRACTNSQNLANMCERGGTSKFKGVSLNLKCTQRPWIAQISVNNKTMYIGAFATEHEAAVAYNKHAAYHFGEFAYLNKIEE